MLLKTISMLQRPSFLKPFQRALILFLFLLSFHCHYGQTVGKIWKQLDSLARMPDTITQDAQYYEIQKATTPISIPSYFTLLGSNLKQQITSPFHTSSKNWKEVGVYSFYGCVGLCWCAYSKASLWSSCKQCHSKKGKQVHYQFWRSLWNLYTCIIGSLWLTI